MSFCGYYLRDWRTASAGYSRCRMRTRRSAPRYSSCNNNSGNVLRRLRQHRVQLPRTMQQTMTMCRSSPGESLLSSRQLQPHVQRRQHHRPRLNRRVEQRLERPPSQSWTAIFWRCMLQRVERRKSQRQRTRRRWHPAARRRCRRTTRCRGCRSVCWTACVGIKLKACVFCSKTSSPPRRR